MIKNEKRKWLVLAALTFGLLAVGLDMTVLNVALPTLATDLNASTSELQWFADAYNLVLAAVLLPAGMLGIPLGPIIGGWLLKHFSWGAVFLINLPLVLIAIAAVAWLMPESKSASRMRIDLVGILTSSAGLVGITYGVIRAGEHGWDDNASLFGIVAGLVSLAIFILWQKRTDHPLIDLLQLQV